jgi:hypothetical protein
VPIIGTPFAVRPRRDHGRVIGDELRRVFSWEERHRRVVARLALVLVLTAVVDVVGTVAVYLTERGVTGGDIHGWGDALFFTTVQLLTVSSQMPNPVTTGGRIVDIILELTALCLVSGIAGVFASFFLDLGAKQKTS